MSGNHETGIKARETLLKKDPDFYKKLGKLGGKVKNSRKGFGTNRELASEVGKIGGQRGKRGKRQTPNSN